MDLEKIQEGLIDKQGRRKYFRELDPKLLDKPPEINVTSIKKKKRIFPLAVSVNCQAQNNQLVERQ